VKQAKPKAAPRRRAAKETANRVLDAILTCLDDHQAEDIVTIDLAGKSTIADYMVIATGRSSRQVAALAEHLGRVVKDHGIVGAAPEGLRQGDWVLIDAGDVIVHLFRPEVRAFYNLEKMWGANLAEAEVG
jgi:ribosome-associated protein